MKRKPNTRLPVTMVVSANMGGALALIAAVVVLFQYRVYDASTITALFGIVTALGTFIFTIAERAYRSRVLDLQVSDAEDALKISLEQLRNVERTELLPTPDEEAKGPANTG